MNGKAFLTIVSSAALALALNATTYTSASYAQREHLMAQWDAIDNVGTGTHDPTATTWKDLAGSNDLTLTNTAAWCRGIGLSMDQKSVGSAAAYGKTVAPSYQTIEIFFQGNITRFPHHALVRRQGAVCRV